MIKYELMGENNYTTNIQETIALNRGIENLKDITETSDDDLLSPFLMNNMRIAVEIFVEALVSSKSVHIVIDSDVDGYASSAILYKYLERAYSISKVTWSVHSVKAHGIKLDELQEYDYDVLVVPDAGSSDFAQHEILAKSGKIVIVLDHHQADKKETPAIIVNPQLDDYPNKALSGAGVTFKFCQAIDNIYGYKFADGLESYVAFGLIADMIDTRPKETRQLITKGIKNCGNSFVMSGLLDLFEKVDHINLSTFSYYFAPLVNAVTRIGTVAERNKMFRAFISEEYEYIKIPTSITPKRRSISSGIFEELQLVKKRQDEIKQELLAECKTTLDLQSEDTVMHYIFKDYTHRAFTGVIAGQIANDYQKPCIILCVDEQGRLSGSGRNYERFELKSLRTYIEQTKIPTKAKGHESAFGIDFESIESSTEFFDLANKELSKYNNNNFHSVDFIVPSNKLSKKIIFQISALDNFYGHKFNTPKIAVEDIIIDVNDIVKNKANTMIKFKIGNDGVVGIAFNNVEEIYNQIMYNSKNNNKSKLVVIGRANLNLFNGVTTCQLILDDLDIVCYNREDSKTLVW